MKRPIQPITMREMPPEERPRERLTRLGPEALRDAELLAVLFRTGTRELSAIAFAEHVISHFVDLRGLSRASVEELQQVHGLGQAKAVEIKAAIELGCRLASHAASRRRISSAQDVVEFLMPRFRQCETEQFITLLLNAKHEVVKQHEVSSGSADATLALPRDVFRKAVRESATAIIVCHNHPSGDPEPSRDDITLTKRLQESGELIGINLVDHIVFGDGRHVSFRERGLL